MKSGQHCVCSGSYRVQVAARSFRSILMDNALAFFQPKGSTKSRGSVILDAFSAFLTRRSENTKRAYTQIFCEWVEFLDSQNTKLEDAITTQAYWFLAAQSKRVGFRGEAVSESTVARKAVVLNKIYKWLVTIGASVLNPFEIVTNESAKPRTGDRRPTKAISNEKVEALLSGSSAYTKNGQRDRAYLGVLFGGALRISEAIGLNLRDVERGGSSCCLRLKDTKAGNDARQALPDWAADRVWLLEVQRRADGAKDSDPLFVKYTHNRAPKAERLSISTAHRLFKNLCSEVNIHGFSPHSARATAITKLLSDGVMHREVQEFSRHSSVLMVETYDKRRISVEDVVAKSLKW